MAEGRKGKPKTAPKRRRRKKSGAKRKPAPAYSFHDEEKPKRRSGSGSGGGRKTAKRRKSTPVMTRLGEAAGLSLRIAAVVFAISAFLFAVFLARLVDGLPDTSALFKVAHTPTITVVDDHGATIGVRGLSQGNFVPLADMPRALPLAVMAVEDRRFYHHIGIDFVGMARAAITNFKAGHIVEGGSTITQQLAKILFLTPDRTYKRKIQEVMLALWLEHKLTKDQILELYLNHVYLGAGTYGVAAASERYFGKPVRDLNLVECAMLAGLLKAPSYYSPAASIKRAGERTAMVLDEMVAAGYISPAERAKAPTEPARLVSTAATPDVDYALDWVINQLPDYIGKLDKDVVVQTSLDLAQQRAAEAALAHELSTEGPTHHASQGALVAMTPDGAVTAMVGGASYEASGYNRAVLARRPPGSAFKPFVYLTALEAGYRPGDTMVDQPIQIGDWRPENYERTYRGPVTLTTALADSINTVAVQLAEAVGPANVIKTARRFGIESPLKPVPSIALGSQGVGLLELTGAYASFANGGDGVIPHVIVSIKTKSGKVLYARRGGGPGRIADPHLIGLLNRMMMQVVAEGTGRAAAIPGQITAGKTGTGEDRRDAWFVGFTAHEVAGVWIGNDDYSPMKGVTGGTLPAHIFCTFMTKANAGLPQVPLPGTEEELPVAENAPDSGISADAAPAPLPAPTDGFTALLQNIARVLGGRS